MSEGFTKIGVNTGEYITFFEEGKFDKTVDVGYDTISEKFKFRLNNFDFCVKDGYLEIKRREDDNRN